MTEHTGKKREGFGRLFVLGGFSLVEPTRPCGRDTEEANDPLEHPPVAAVVALVREARQELRTGTRESRREEDEGTTVDQE